VKLPFDASVTVPLEGFAPSVAVSVVPASTSVSFASTLPLTGISSVVEAVSLTATGASFTPVTVIVTVATFETAVPSVAV
jgi:hypothetical protein